MLVGELVCTDVLVSLSYSTEAYLCFQFYVGLVVSRASHLCVELVGAFQLYCS